MIHEWKDKSAKKGIYPENSTMKGNPRYAIIDSLVLLVGPDAVLLELPPDQAALAVYTCWACEIAARHSGNMKIPYSALNDLLKYISIYHEYDVDNP